MLGNFPSYLTNIANEQPNFLLDELENRQYYKPKGWPPFSSEIGGHPLG